MIIECIILLFITFLLCLTLYGSQKEAGTPPGSPGLPFFGHMLYQGGKPLIAFLNEYRLKYGEIFWLKLGSIKIVFITDYEIIKEAFNNPMLSARWQDYSNNLFRRGDAKTGVIFNDGVAWKNVRRFSIKYLRDGGMGKSTMEGIITREAEDLIEDFEKHLGTPTTLPWSLNVAIFNVIWRLVADERFDIDDKRMKQLHECLAKSLNASQSALMPFVWLPILDKLIPNFIQQYNFDKIQYDEQLKIMEDEMMKTVDNHRKALDEDNPKDLIDAYLIELNKLTKNPEQHSEAYSTFSERELVYLVFDFFIAGSETTSSTIRWFLLFMIKNPDVQRKIHEEMDRVVPKDKMPNLSHKLSLPYLEAAIHETMRLRTLLPAGLIHKASEDTNVAGYLIPKDTMVCALLEAVHKKPKFWEKPNEFYPEHFLNTEDMSFNTKKVGLIAFSTGKRVCLGESLARMELYLILSALMKKFTFSAPEGQDISTEQRADQPMISIPKNFNIIINKR